MNLRQWLRDADPLAHEQAPAAEDVARMRQRVVAAVDERDEALTWRVRIAWAGAAAAVILALVVGITSRRSDPAPTVVMRPTRQMPAAVGAPVKTGVEPGTVNTRRQLQFATPGGTRIIWVFNSDFKL